jgi:hypothetical protein
VILRCRIGQECRSTEVLLNVLTPVKMLRRASVVLRIILLKPGTVFELGLCRWPLVTDFYFTNSVLSFSTKNQ